MTLHEIFEEVFMNAEERELFLCTENARDNIKDVLQNNDDSFSKNYSLPDFQSVLQRVKLQYQANKSKSKQQLAVESYCIEMGMTDNDTKKLKHLVESKNNRI